MPICITFLAFDCKKLCAQVHDVYKIMYFKQMNILENDLWAEDTQSEHHIGGGRCCHC